MEWASVEDPDTPGHVYAKYEKYGNKMHTTAAQVAAVLDEMRAEYRAQLDNGLSAEEAWRATMAMGPGRAQHVAKARHHAVGSLLSEGVRGPRVGELQAHLNSLGYTDSQGRLLTIDQDFGPGTRYAIETIQRDQNLQVDGVAGPHTWAALREASHALSVHPPVTPAVNSATATAPPPVAFLEIAPPDLDAPAIRTLQQHLNTLQIADHRNPALSITGAYDEATRAAVMAFQQRQGLPGTGMPDAATRALVEARATIAKWQQSANGYSAPTRDTSWLEAPAHEPRTPSVTAQSQPQRLSDSNLQRADLGHDVGALQQQLRRLGYTDARGHPLHVDGHFGPATHAATHHRLPSSKRMPQRRYPEQPLHAGRIKQHALPVSSGSQVCVSMGRQTCGARNSMLAAWLTGCWVSQGANA